MGQIDDWIITFFLYSPIVPLGLAWFVTFRSKNFEKTQRFFWPLIATTISFTWLNLGRLFPAALGSYYSNARALIMDLNFFVMIICAAVAFSKKSSVRILTGIAALLSGLAWAMVAGINASV